MTINATAAILLALYLAVAERQGIPATALAGTVQNDILKEFIARGTYIFPPGPSLRLVTDVFGYCQDRVPRWNTISISGYHLREAGSTAVQEVAFTLANAVAYVQAAQAAGLAGRRVRAPAVVLLQRAQRPPGGGREVPGRAPALGPPHARAVRRPGPARVDASVPRPDGGLDADGPAAREQRGARHRAGAGRDPRGLPVAPHQLDGRGPVAPLRGRRPDRAPDPADPRARVGRGGERRPPRRGVPGRAPHPGHRGRRDGLPRQDRRARRRGGGDSLHAARDPGRGVSLPAGGREPRADRRGRQRVRERRGASDRALPARAPRSRAGKPSGSGTSAGGGTGTGRPAPSTPSSGRPAGPTTWCRGSSTPCRPRSRWARSAPGCALSSASTARRWHSDAHAARDAARVERRSRRGGVVLALAVLAALLGVARPARADILQDLGASYQKVAEQLAAAFPKVEVQVDRGDGGRRPDRGRRRREPPSRARARRSSGGARCSATP